MDSAFVTTPSRLPLLTESGKAFAGLSHSKSPELAERTRSLLHRLDDLIGFPETHEGARAQTCFNQLVRAAYPELALDLADLIYVQHERPAVYLNFDHININLRRENRTMPEPMEILNKRMQALFLDLTRTLRRYPSLSEDAEVVRLLSESYSFYLHQTGNFPWDDPLPELSPLPDGPVLDVATGLSGFSMIHLWPDTHPQLILTDSMPFVVEALTHYRDLSGKTNVDILKVEYGREDPQVSGLGLILANKFLHHLQRRQRQHFLDWAYASLKPGAALSILDTDLEHHILKKSRQPEFLNTLIAGYLETLVEIETDFCKTLVRDTQSAGFNVPHFDFNQYEDETDAYSQQPGDNVRIQFLGFEIRAQKPELEKN